MSQQFLSPLLKIEIQIQYDRFDQGYEILYLKKSQIRVDIITTNELGISQSLTNFTESENCLFSDRLKDVVFSGVTELFLLKTEGVLIWNFSELCKFLPKSIS